MFYIDELHHAETWSVLILATGQSKLQWWEQVVIHFFCLAALRILFSFHRLLNRATFFSMYISVIQVTSDPALTQRCWIPRVKVSTAFINGTVY